jgi:hypothetical protein
MAEIACELRQAIAPYVNDITDPKRSFYASHIAFLLNVDLIQQILMIH